MYPINLEKKQTLSKKVKNFIRDLIIIFIIGLLLSLFFSDNYKSLLANITPIAIYSTLMGLALWKGNEFVSIWVHKHADWKGKPEHKFLIGIVTMIIYTIAAIYLVHYIIYLIWRLQGIDGNMFPNFRIVIILLGVTFIVALTINMKEFIIEKRDILIREEKLKTEIVKLEYETLKNQVNPHFLFNSLNTLTSLVSDNEEGVKFIKNLSDVYRYVLDQKDKEVVSLSTEIQFVNAYLYLHKIRFGENLLLDINIKSVNQLVVPISVQMLVENAIKHNIISEDEPLKISIYEESDYLVVENNLQLKSVINESSKIGLKNIQSRYAYLTDKEFIVNSLPDKFIVKVPLLQMIKK
jgi:hypothetical protein